MAGTLEDLIDRVAEALLRGDIAQLARLAPEVEASAGSGPHDRATAERLRRKADRNARLLQAAGRGISAARARLTELARGPVLTTYDARGRRETVAPVDVGPAKRL